MDIPFTPPPSYQEVIHSQSYTCEPVLQTVMTLRPESKASRTEEGKGELGNMRWDAMRDESMRLGVQYGYQIRSKDININLDNPEVKTRLNRVYNFQVLETKQNIIPPVITEAKESMNVDDDGQSARMSKRTWEIIVPARISTIPPHWSSYLFVPKITPKESVFALMPSNSEEETIWKTSFCKGFDTGIQQANITFETGLNRLTRDYIGMVRFMDLVAQNIISMPSVQESRLGVTIDGRQMFVDDRTLKIEAPSYWKPSKNMMNKVKLDETPQ